MDKWSVGRSASHPKLSTLSPVHVECRKKCLPPKTFNPLPWKSGLLEGVSPIQIPQTSHLDRWGLGRGVSHPKPSTLSPGQVECRKECPHPKLSTLSPGHVECRKGCLPPKTLTLSPEQVDCKKQCLPPKTNRIPWTGGV